MSLSRSRFTYWTEKENSIISEYLPNGKFQGFDIATLNEILEKLKEISPIDRSLSALRCRVTRICEQKGSIDYVRSSRCREPYAFSYDDVLKDMIELARKQYLDGTVEVPGFLRASYHDLFAYLKRGSESGLNSFLNRNIRNSSLIVARKGLSHLGPTIWDLRSHMNDKLIDVWRNEKQMSVNVVEDVQEAEAQPQKVLIYKELANALKDMTTFCSKLTQDLDDDQLAKQNSELNREVEGLKEQLAERDAAIAELHESAIRNFDPEATARVGQLKANMLRAIDDYNKKPIWRKHESEEVFLTALINDLESICQLIDSE